jgi:hypothetical protein
MKLVSLKSAFQYESNDTNYIQYNQVFVVQFLCLKFVLKYACVLFLETEIVTN